LSLLLEALKKAEKAKEEAQRRARGESLPAQAPLAAEPAADAAAVPTRDQLPEIDEPLELFSEQAAPKRDEPALTLAEDQPSPPQRVREKKGAADAQASERVAARKVFEAKFREPNPRLPFFISLGVLGVFALGTVGYFWYQLRPPPSLVNLNPAPSGEVHVAATAPRPPPAPSAPSGQAAILGLPGGAAPPAPAPAPISAAATVSKPAPAPAARAPEVPLLKPSARGQIAAAAAVRDSGAEIIASRAAPQVHPRVNSGYKAYLAGDLGVARAEYQEALRDEPSNRDALFGLAALDVRGGRFAAAEAAYVRLLQSDPRDAHAQAALIALRSGRVDPLTAESRVKSLLAENPAAHVLNFTLGNQFAQQGRWAEAQQEYFKAFAAEPDNPDFAYNVAVSLDQLRQPLLALKYYQHALALAEKRAASFDAAGARNRVAQLGG
jgi:tetratricopeptide (TPR) repeat protein